jgi:hypothetical protein
MSNSFTISNTPRNTAFSVRLRPDIVPEIYEIAEQRHLSVEALVNEILQLYVADQVTPVKSDGAAFLLTLAGSFNSGVVDTSENVRAVVTDFILHRHGQAPV